MTNIKMRYFSELHPTVSMLYFVSVLALTLTCRHPIMCGLSLIGAILFSHRLRGTKAVKMTMCFVAPMFLLIALANPLFCHKGVTMLFMINHQWYTLEAILYGLVSAMQLSAVVFWFTCYQEVMTSDKFLYLFGKIAPGASLLITMTLRLIPVLQEQGKIISETHQLLQEKDKRLFQKLGTALRNLSTLLTWSMENAVVTADSMKARGYGLFRRTTFHLFHFDSRDGRTLGIMLSLSGIVLIGRLFGHGYMEFYPHMEKVITGIPGIIMYFVFMALVLLPSVLEIKEEIIWRSYGFAN
ncbi:MAG: energy-coupling factor transporter transmembrane component T [Oscillospiraceae bacterium]